MNLLFWRKQRGQLDTLAWNVMVAATDPDKIWEMAQQFRSTKMPGSVLTCEASFLVASQVRGMLEGAAAIAPDRRRQCVIAAESAFFKTFDDQSDEPLPAEMAAIYGNVRLGHVARIAFAGYAECGDALQLAAPIFVSRIKGDPRMAYEIAPIVQERMGLIARAFLKAAAEAR